MPINRLENLRRYFGPGTAETELEIGGETFVCPPHLEEILVVSPRQPRLLVGPKGMGKTAILEHVRSESSKQDIPALKLLPSELDLNSIRSSDSTAQLRQAFLISLVTALAEHVGAHLDGLLTGDRAALYEAAVKAGLRRPSRMKKTGDLLSALAKPISGIDLAGLSKALTGKETTSARLSQLNSTIGSGDGIVLLLIDDTDQVANPNSRTQLNRVWSLLLAARDLAIEIPVLRVLVAVRSEVWRRLDDDEAGQQDQVDHLRPLVVELKASDQFLRDVLHRRFSLAARDANCNENNPVRCFFEDVEMTLPGTGDDKRPWTTFISKNARERPRDMIQLVEHLIRSAKNRESSCISSMDADLALVPYSEERQRDVGVEFKAECPQLSEIVASLARLEFDAGFRVPFERLRNFLQGLPGSMRIQVYGGTLPPDSPESAIRILEVLHEAGIINPRVIDNSRPKGYRHVVASEGQRLVKKANWNEIQNLTFELHPAFRTFLQRKKKALRLSS